MLTCDGASLGGARAGSKRCGGEEMVVLELAL